MRTPIRSSPTRPLTRAGPRIATPRERIDQTAYELFSRRGVRAVGVDEVVARSGVAKMTLYRHYPSKNHLALGFLRRREELWTRAWLQSGLEQRGGTPGEKLLAVFEIFDKWFRRADFEGCSFINILLETDRTDHPVRVATIAHLASIREILSALADDAGVRDPDAFAREWHILMKGSIVAAGEGDRDAALRAREIGRLILAREGVAVDASTKGRMRPAGRLKKIQKPRAR
ncbi:MAG: TetR/AcrR family transcriptional regulator [Burkholderiales bacterium]